MTFAPFTREAPLPALLAFIRAWVPELSASHRMDPQNIPHFVPQPLRRVYELTGNYPIPNTEQWRRPSWRPGLFGTQDQLLPPNQLRLAGERFAFIHENQGVWSCETMVGLEDPPVFSDADMSESTGMHEVCPSLSHFLTTFCLQELAFGSAYLYCVDSPDIKPAEVVAAPLTDLWLEGTYVYGESTHSFYLCQEELLVMDIHGDLWLAFNNERCLSFLKPGPRTRRIH